MIVPHGSAPESWLCIDCGINTAPRMSNREQLEQAFSVIRADHTPPQHINSNTELYMVKSSIWKEAGMEDFGGCLCIGCIETRLGTPKDFTRDHPFNTMPGTKRLLDRRGGR